jgi:hypothetical protein
MKQEDRLRLLLGWGFNMADIELYGFAGGRPIEGPRGIWVRLVPAPHQAGRACALGQAAHGEQVGLRTAP